MTNSILVAFQANLDAFYEKAKAGVEAFVAAFVPQIENAVEIAFEELASIAGSAILTEATKLISGQEKFGNAVTNVVQTVEASGKTVAINTAQAAVQIAYLDAKAIASGQK